MVQNVGVRSARSETVPADEVETYLAQLAPDGSWPDIDYNNRARTYWTTDDWQETAVLEFDLGAERTFNVVLLQEHIAVGQRIEKFVVEAHTPRGWEPVAKGRTVGYKRLLRCKETTADKVRVRIEESRFAPTLQNFGLFKRSKK